MAAPASRVRAAWRPPARVWLRWAASFQPGLTVARTEAEAKEALMTGATEMGVDPVRLGLAWDSLLEWGPVPRSSGAEVSEEADASVRMPLSVSILWWAQTRPTASGSLSVHICRLESLESLILPSLRMTALPDVIGRLTNLTHLDLKYNELAYVPGAIGRLTNLVRLELGSNRLTTLPDAMGQLVNLAYLDLNNNQLTHVPISISRLTRLMYLNVESNRLKALSDAICQLPTLKWLYIGKNRFSKAQKLHIQAIVRCVESIL